MPRLAEIVSEVPLFISTPPLSVIAAGVYVPGTAPKLVSAAARTKPPLMTVGRCSCRSVLSAMYGCELLLVLSSIDGAAAADRGRRVADRAIVVEGQHRVVRDAVGARGAGRAAVAQLQRAARDRGVRVSIDARQRHDAIAGLDQGVPYHPS